MKASVGAEMLFLKEHYKTGAATMRDSPVVLISRPSGVCQIFDIPVGGLADMSHVSPGVNLVIGDAVTLPDLRVVERKAAAACDARHKFLSVRKFIDAALSEINCFRRQTSHLVFPNRFVW